MSDEQIAALKEPGGQHGEVFNAQEQAVLHFTDLLTSYPGNVTQAELDALAEQFSQEQIVELVMTIAAANFTNRINEGLRTPIG